MNPLFKMTLTSIFVFELFLDRKLIHLHYPMSTPTSQHLFVEAVGLKLYRYIKTQKVTILNLCM